MRRFLFPIYATTCLAFAGFVILMEVAIQARASDDEHEARILTIARAVVPCSSEYWWGYRVVAQTTQRVEKVGGFACIDMLHSRWVFHRD
ncbi:MAG: hypothetical protein NTV56_19770 [Alphaproteobacteria bacterium]|nr:hypothetical protein [Alphaproteobacteria bacterium]